jgi:hypothetical protein
MASFLYSDERMSIFSEAVCCRPRSRRITSFSSTAVTVMVRMTNRRANHEKLTVWVALEPSVMSMKLWLVENVEEGREDVKDDIFRCIALPCRSQSCDEVLNG